MIPNDDDDGIVWQFICKNDAKYELDREEDTNICNYFPQNLLKQSQKRIGQLETLPYPLYQFRSASASWNSTKDSKQSIITSSVSLTLHADTKHTLHGHNPHWQSNFQSNHSMLSAIPFKHKDCRRHQPSITQCNWKCKKSNRLKHFLVWHHLPHSLLKLHLEWGCLGQRWTPAIARGSACLTMDTKIQNFNHKHHQNETHINQ